MRLKLLLIILILNLVLASKSQDNSYTVYNDLLIKVIGTKRYHVPFTNIFKYDSITQQKLWHSYIYAENRPIDKRDLYIGVNDTLMVHDSDKESLRFLIKNQNKVKREIIIKLLNEKSNKELIDIRNIKQSGRYKLFKRLDYRRTGLRKYVLENEDKARIAGWIILSDVVFNLENTKACFYYSISDHSGHGHPAQIVFAEKRNGVWCISEKVSL